MDAECSNVLPPSHYCQSGMVDSNKAAGVDTKPHAKEGICPSMHLSGQRVRPA